MGASATETAGILVVKGSQAFRCRLLRLTLSQVGEGDLELQLKENQRLVHPIDGLLISLQNGQNFSYEVFLGKVLVDGITSCSGVFFSQVFRLGLTRHRKQMTLPSVFVCELCAGADGLCLVSLLLSLETVLCNKGMGCGEAWSYLQSFQGGSEIVSFILLWLIIQSLAMNLNLVDPDCSFTY